MIGSSSIGNYGLTEELKIINPVFQGVDIELMMIPGSTIAGFGKRNSTLNSMQRFTERYKKSLPDYVCFAFGQTDIELGIYHKLVVKGEDFLVHEHIEKLVEIYIKSISDICKTLSINKDKVIIKGNNVSVFSNRRVKAINYVSRIISENVADADKKIELKKKLVEKYPSVLERLEYTYRFNNLLRDVGSSYGFKYFDINDEIEDKMRPGHVKLEYIHASPNHHIIDSLFVREFCIRKLINSCIAKGSS